MNRIEERYRSVLRILPADYRRTWEDDMVAAYLESVATADPDAAQYLADYGRPSWPEVASVIALAVRLRLGLTGSPAPRAVVWGDAIRLAALIGLFFNAVLTLASAVTMLWLIGYLPVLPAPPDLPPVDRSPLQLVLQLIAMSWIAAFVALVSGRWRLAQALALVGLAPGLVLALVDAVTTWRPGLISWASFAADVLLVLALRTYVAGSPPVRRGPWLAALVVGAIPTTILLMLPVLAFDVRRPPPVDGPALTCVLFVAAAFGYLAARKRVQSTWSLALALLGGTVLALRLLTLVQYLSSPDLSSWVVAGAVEALAVAAVGVPVTAMAAGALQRLPVAGGDPT